MLTDAMASFRSLPTPEIDLDNSSTKLFGNFCGLVG